MNLDRDGCFRKVVPYFRHKKRLILVSPRAGVVEEYSWKLPANTLRPTNINPYSSTF
jgi:hypothetical protein